MLLSVLKRDDETAMKKHLKKALIVVLSITMVFTILPWSTGVSFADDATSDDFFNAEVSVPVTSAADAEETAAPTDVEETTPVNREETYTVTLNDDFPLNTDAHAGRLFEWIGGATFEVYDEGGNVVTDEEIRSRYSFQIINVTGTEEGFEWDMGESYVLSPVNDVIYTVQFAIVETATGEQVSPTYTRTIKTYNSSEILPLLDTDDQYVTKAWIDPSTYQTGFAPWDADNNPGNDENATNNIVRSFDSIHYEVIYQTKSYSENYYKEGYVGFLILMADENGDPLDPDGSEAYVVKDSLSWMKTDSANSKLNRKIGKKEFTVNGVTQTYSYVQGYLHLVADEEADNVMPVASSSVEFDVNAGAMINGSTIKPLVYVWCQHNDFGDTDGDGIIDVVDPSHVCENETSHAEATNGGKELVQVAIPKVIVSAFPRYNIQLKTYNSDGNTWGISGILSTYDFSTGNDKALDKDAGSIYGRGYGMGITIQLYNSNSDKNLKGIEFPRGDIQLDINFSGKFTPDSPNGAVYPMDYTGAEAGFAPLIWSTEGNKGGAGQQDGRNLSQLTTEGFPRYVAPYNKKGANDVLTDGYMWGTASCYNGGTWNVERIDGDTIRYTIKDYKINSSWFPAQNGLLLDWQYSANRYWDPRLGIENSCHIGCFSAAELWVVLPLISPSGERLEDHHAPNGAEYGSGTETFFVEDSSLVATSASGVNVGYRDEDGNYYVGTDEPGDEYTQVTDKSNQENTNDDKLSFTAETYKWVKGTYSASVKYSSPSITDLYWIYDASSIPGITQVGPATSNGKDVAEISQPISFWWRTSVGVGKNNDVINSSYGTNALVLFDDAGVRLNSEASRMSNTEHSGYQRTKFLFAAKPDGTGWKHYGLNPDSTDEDGNVWYYDEATNSITTTKKTYLAYDYEQTTTKEADLVYYASYAELVADGKVCVGVLGEARSLTKSTSTKYATFKNLIKVRDDAKMGYVYQIDIKSMAWTARTYENAGFSAETDGDIVSRMDIQNGTATAQQTSLFNSPTYRGNTTKYYIKSTYDENGVYTGGHSPDDTVRGDSLYIIPFRPSITKYILQVKESGATKEVYNMDENQNIVDFRLTTKIYQRVPNESDYVSTTTLIVKDTLPKGVTYNEDAMLGGEYTKSATPGYHGSWSGGALPGETFDLTLKNGETYTIEFPEPEVTVSTSGVTTLTFKFADFPVSADPVDIFYSVTIDNSAENGQTYKNIAEVETSEVHMISHELYETYSEVNFSVIRTFTISLSKLTEKSFVDISAQIGYTMAWQNVGNNDVTNAPMLDILPYNGDGNGTSFSGTYTLAPAKLTNNNGTKTSPIKDFTGLRVFYTTDTAVRNIDQSLWRDDSIQAGEVTDLDGNTFTCPWTEATVNADGTITGIDENATAFCILGTLKSKKMIEAACVIHPTNNEPGDKYVNAISIKGSTTIARGIVLNRILSGLAWYDENFDGARQATEKKLAGVTVTLVNKADFDAATSKKGLAALFSPKSSSTVTSIDPAINLRGEECVTTTGDDGKYEFAYLAAGDYVAIFTDGETILSDFLMSPLEADTAREVNNSNTILAPADAEGHVDYGYIYITMPPADDIKASPYMIRNEDMGLVEAINIYGEKKWKTADGGEEPPEGAKITFTLTGGGKTYTVELDGTPDDPLAADAIGAFESAAWYATFQNLPKYDVDSTGKPVEIEYELTETVTWPGFAESYSDNCDALTSGDVGTVTNKEETTEVYATKAWKSLDGTARYPEGAKVTFTLYADGVETTYTVELDGTADATAPTVPGGYESDSWVAGFVNLPKYKVVDGQAVEIEYTVDETVSFTGYTADNDAPVSNNGTITNEEEPTQFQATKAWKNIDGTTTYPEGAKVTFTLLADGVETTYTVELDGTADNDVPTVTGGYESEAWVAKFVNLPKYNYENGQATEIVYTAKETVTFTGYTPESENPVANNGIITNKQEDTSLTVIKEWMPADMSGQAPAGGVVTFTLYADGTLTDYKVTLDGRPDPDPDGTAGYEIEAWKAAFVNLPKYKFENGKATEIKYTVVETGTWPGYTVSYGDNQETFAVDGGTILNEEEITGIKVTKAWKNADGTTTAPEGAEVTFTLYADGEPTQWTVTLRGIEDSNPIMQGGQENEPWVAYFVRLPKYRIDDKEGEAVEIQYTVVETGTWPGYTVSYGDGTTEEFAVDNGTITNEQITTEVSGIKTWNDDDFFVDGVPVNGYQRPESITINLLADGEKIDSKIVTEQDGWEYEFTDLPKYKIVDGAAVEIEYTVEEEVLPGYATVVEGTDVENTPVWADEVGDVLFELRKVDALTYNGEDKPKNLAGAVFIWTTADGTEIPLTTGADGTIAFLIGVDGTHYLQEVQAPDGYENPGTLYTIEVTKVFNRVELVDDPNAPGGKIWTWYYDLEMEVDSEDFNENTMTLVVKDPPELIDISGEKIWDDKNNAEGLRPSSITVELLADNVKIDEKVVTAADNWKFTFTDLPKMKDGKEIAYTVDEVPVPEYTTTIKGFTITNTHLGTGDNMNLSLWIGLFVIALAAVGIMAIRKLIKEK